MADVPPPGFLKAESVRIIWEGITVKYTRSQCAKLFGISMDALRYYEKLGLLDASHEKSGHRAYTESEIMRLLEYRLIKSLGGLSNEELLPLFDREKGPSHRAMFEASVQRLRERREEIDRHIALVTHIDEVFRDVYSKLDTIRIGDLPERQFLLFEQENEPWIPEVMRHLPHLKYGYWIDRDCLSGEKDWDVKLAVDVSLLRAYDPQLYADLHANGRIRSNAGGLKVYRYRIYGGVEDLHPDDFTPLIEYARAHNFSIAGDVFGGIIGPERFPDQGKDGFILTQTLRLE